jgi:hypothetical protein
MMLPTWRVKVKHVSIWCLEMEKVYLLMVEFQRRFADQHSRRKL